MLATSFASSPWMLATSMASFLTKYLLSSNAISKQYKRRYNIGKSIHINLSHPLSQHPNCISSFLVYFHNIRIVFQHSSFTFTTSELHFILPHPLSQHPNCISSFLIHFHNIQHPSSSTFKTSKLHYILPHPLSHRPNCILTFLIHFLTIRIAHQLSSSAFTPSTLHFNLPHLFSHHPYSISTFLHHPTFISSFLIHSYTNPIAFHPFSTASVAFHIIHI